LPTDYGIQREDNDLWYAGTADHEPVWVDQDHATAYQNRALAETRAKGMREGFGKEKPAPIPAWVRPL
jgi:hypothetical protein